MSDEAATAQTGRQLRISKKMLFYVLLLFVVSWATLEVGKQMDEQLEKLVPESVTEASTFNKRPSGYHALLELLQKSGIAASAFQTSYRELKKEAGTLVVIAPMIPLQDFEIDHLASWVAKGNRLVYMDYFAFHGGRSLLSKLGLSSSDSKGITDEKFKADPDLPVMQHVKELVLSAETRLEGGISLVKDDYGGLVVEVSHGKGKALICVAPSLAANRRIADEANRGNFQFLVNWLDDGKPVLFDEKCHGHSLSPSLLTHLAHSALGLATTQLVVIFLVTVFSLNQRFGKAKVFAPTRKIANLEFIEGMAQTYRKARARDTATIIIFHAFKARLCKRLGVSPEESEEILGKAWSEATGIALNECLDLLERASHLANNRNMTSDDMQKFVATLDRLAERSKASLALAPRRMGA